MPVCGTPLSTSASAPDTPTRRSAASASSCSSFQISRPARRSPATGAVRTSASAIDRPYGSPSCRTYGAVTPLAARSWAIAAAWWWSFGKTRR